MKVKQIKKTDDVVSLEAVASAEEVNQALQAAKISFARSMGMKPPAQGQSIDQAAEDQMGIKDLDSIVEKAAIEALVPLALDKKNIVPLYPPQAVAKSPFKGNEEFRFEFDVALKPEYELSSYEPVSISVPPFSANSAVIDEQLKEMAQRYTTYTDDPSISADKVVEKGDHIKIALKAFEDGKELEGLTTDGRTYTAGEGYMPEGFDQAILGMKVGETKEFTFEGPDLDEDMNERTQVVDATVTVLGFEKEDIPVIDDAWVQKNMPMYKNLDELKAEMTKGIEKQARAEYDAYVRQLAAQELIDRFQGKIPDEVYEHTRDQMLSDIQMSLQQQGMTWDEFLDQNGGEQQVSMMLMMQIRQMLVQGFALDAYYRHHGLSITDDDILEACRAMNPQANPQQMRKQTIDAGRGFALREIAERLKANNHLVEHADITVVDPAAAQAAPSAQEAAQN